MAQPIGALRAELSANAARFEKDMGRARRAVGQSSSRMQRSMRGFRNVMERTIRSIVSLRGAAVAAAGVAGFGLLARRAISTADAVGKMADQLGVGVEELQELRFVAGRFGIDQNRLDQSMQAFTRRLGQARQGTGQARRALDELNISMRELEGRTPVDALELVADRLEDVQDPMRRNAVLADLFSRQGIIMGNMLSEGASEMQRLRKRARDLGLVMDEQLVRNAESANDQLSDLGQILRIRVTSAVVKLAPHIDKLVRNLIDNLPEIVAWTERWAKALGFIEEVGADTRIHEIDREIASILDSQREAAEFMGVERDQLTEGRDFLSAALDFFGVDDPRVARIEQQNRQLEELARERADLLRAGAARAGRPDQERPTPGPLPDPDDPTDRLEDEIGTVRRLDISYDDLVVRQQRVARENTRLRGQRMDDMWREVERVIEQTKTAQERYNEEAKLLKTLHDEGKISTDQYVRALQQAAGELRKTAEESDRAERAGRDLGLTFSSAFEDAIIAGEGLRNVLAGIFDDINRILLRETVTGPLAGFIQGAIGSAFGGATSGFASTGGFGSAPKFATGGSFRVGGAGGMDSQMVQFMASPGEEVTVTPRSQSSPGGNQFFVDMRGASVEAVARLERLVQQVNGSIEGRAVNAVMDFQART